MNKEKLEMVYLKKDYQGYIKPFCSKHQLLDKGERLRPFVGVVLKGLHGKDYFVPLTSSEKDRRYQQQIDVYALNYGKNGVLNINLMIPVPNDSVIRFDIDNIPKCPYKDLIQRQVREVNKNRRTIMTSAAEVYTRCLFGADVELAARCNDFLLLEEKAGEWELKKAEQRQKNAPKQASDGTAVAADVAPTAAQYKATDVYKKAVEKYGQKRADKIVDELLAKELKTQEKKKAPSSKPKGAPKGKTTVTTTVKTTTVKSQPRTPSKGK